METSFVPEIQIVAILVLSTWRLSRFVASESGWFGVGILVRYIGMKPGMNLTLGRRETRMEHWRKGMMHQTNLGNMDAINQFGVMLSCIYCRSFNVFIFLYIWYLVALTNHAVYVAWVVLVVGLAGSTLTLMLDSLIDWIDNLGV